MIKMIFFDWNGTLLADTNAQFTAVCRAIECYGGKPPKSVGEFRNTLITPFFDYYISRGCDRDRIVEEPGKFREFFEAEYDKISDKCRTRKGSREILKLLKSRGITPVILSNHPTLRIEKHLVRLGIIGEFAKVIGHPIQKEYSSKSRRMLSFLSSTKIFPHETAIIGDAPDDILTAKKTGAIGVSITDGLFCTASLRVTQPHYLVSNLLELKDIIESHRG